MADRLVESLDPTEDGYVRQLWMKEALNRRDDIRSGRFQTIPGSEALARARKAFSK
ncbi:MAG: addiction module protein [Proteobacteria bacterium]|nr:addiction module protein [Pseudomonadota bacterium]